MLCHFKRCYSRFFVFLHPFYACKSLIKQHLNTFKAILNGIIALFALFYTALGS
nr:MAG TPA: hypothetical protein [Caudoviricetes sp.]